MLRSFNKVRVISFLLLVFLLLGFTYITTSDANAASFTVPGDFATIKEALSSSSVVDGDRIFLLAGTYNESNIGIKKQVRIIGAGLGVTIIDAGGGQGFRIRADNVRIEDLTVQNAKLGIRMVGAGLVFDNIDIMRVEFLNNNTGIIISGTSTVTNLLVKECEFENNGKGITLNKEAHLDGGLIRDSLFDNNDIGINVFNRGFTSTMNNVKILGNTFSNHTTGRSTAIYLEEAQNSRILSNLFMDNFNDVVISKIYQPAVPVEALRVYNNTMMGTTGTVFSIFNADNGGQTIFNDVRFLSNDITTADAIVILAGAYRTDPPGLGGTGWDTVNIKNNCVTGTTSDGRGIKFRIPAGIMPDDALGGDILRARKNWWGTASLAAVTDLMQIPAVIDFEPILTSCGL